jgi:glycosyltransferase involved in cell wall biosynthesis
MPTLAVIIAAKGAGRWLGNCIASVLSQRLPAGWSLGVAVGIDACPATLAMASRFAHSSRVAFRYFPDHVGPYVVYNSLACVTRADVIARFDADDIMLPGYLAAQVGLLDQELRPMIVRTWSTFVDEALQPHAALLADGTRLGPDGHRRNTSDGQFLMTRAVFTRLGGFQGWPCHADTEFLQRARWSGTPFQVVEQCLYLRRVHPTSLTASANTGYRSILRQHFAQQIRESRRGYASGVAPERIRPDVARYVPVGHRG